MFEYMESEEQDDEQEEQEESSIFGSSLFLSPSGALMPSENIFGSIL